MEFDSERVAMSIRGSYITLRRQEGGLALVCSDHAGEKDMWFTCHLAPDAHIRVAPGRFGVHSREADFSVALYGKYGVLLQGRGPLELRYRFPQGYNAANAAVEEDGAVRICDNGGDGYLRARCRRGTLRLDAPWEAGRVACPHIVLRAEPDAGGNFSFAMEKTVSMGSVAAEIPSFEQAERDAREDFAAWAQALGAKSPLETEAAYVLWANTVAPLGNYRDEAVLCSKLGMEAVWSWDQCFHALGVARGLPELAYAQFQLPFLYMDGDGALPDTILPFAVRRTFTKPPVHGITYRWLMEKHAFFREGSQLKWVLEALEENTRWWLGGREQAPCYWHGNDSGADNASCFDRYPAIQTPELIGLLAVQCQVMGELAEMLGQADKRARFRAQAEALAQEITRRFWDGTQLLVRPLDGGGLFESGSLLPYRAVVAGRHLPAELRAGIVDRIQKRFLSPFGLASEALDSPAFRSGGYDSYWRGSVWAPDQIVFCKALEDLGERELAAEIRSRYARALERGGFAENSDAHTGRGNCCASFSWAAAALFA